MITLTCPDDTAGNTAANATTRRSGVRRYSFIGSVSPSAVEDQLSDANRIDPHRHVTPARHLDPPGVRRQSLSTTRPLRKNPVALTERDGNRNRDVVP